MVRSKRWRIYNRNRISRRNFHFLELTRSLFCFWFAWIWSLFQSKSQSSFKFRCCFSFKKDRCYFKIFQRIYFRHIKNWMSSLGILKQGMLQKAIKETVSSFKGLFECSEATKYHWSYINSLICWGWQILSLMSSNTRQQLSAY